MGVKENVNELLGYLKSKNVENSIDKELLQKTLKTGKVKDEYFTFVNSLMDNLSERLGEGSANSSIEYQPNSPEYVKYFRIAKEDSRIISLYIVNETAGGSFIFTPKDLESLLYD